MASPPLAKLSSKGQVVLPKSVRDTLRLEPGDVFTVHGSEDTIYLQKVALPAKEEFEAGMAQGRAFAKAKGVKREEVERVIKSYRRERRA